MIDFNGIQICFLMFSMKKNIENLKKFRVHLTSLVLSNQESNPSVIIKIVVIQIADFVILF